MLTGLLVNTAQARGCTSIRLGGGSATPALLRRRSASSPASRPQYPRKESDDRGGSTDHLRPVAAQRRGPPTRPGIPHRGRAAPRWPIWLAIGLLIIGGVTSAAVSDWFVETLQPVMTALHLSPAFTGLVVVAIAGNAIENAVGLQLAFRNHSDYALSIIIHSPLQAALLVASALVLISQATPTTLTLVFAPLLVAALVVAALVVAVLLVTFIVFDGESNWLEGAILTGLYIIVAALFWWG
jgi:Ca2+:H+ antiporter